MLTKMRIPVLDISLCLPSIALVVVLFQGGGTSGMGEHKGEAGALVLCAWR